MNGVHFERENEKTPRVWWHNRAILWHTMDKRVVITLAGGTGPFALLSQVKHLPCSVSAIVTMSDSGGSSRRLMDEFVQLPLGDLRHALVALSRRSALWRDIFARRFPDQPTLTSMRMGIQLTIDNSHADGGGHGLGNLIISALQELSGGDLLQALADAEDLLDTAGRVLLVMLSRATHCTVLADEDTICDEAEVDCGGPGHSSVLPSIQRLYLQERPMACHAALHAIRHEGIIVLGLGDLYTSVLPNLLVDGMAEAIRSSAARKVYICNLATKYGVTDAFHASDFVREIHRYLSDGVDRVILHDGSLPEPVRTRYATEDQYSVEPDMDEVCRFVSQVRHERFPRSAFLWAHSPRCGKAAERRLLTVCGSTVSAARDKAIAAERARKMCRQRQSPPQAEGRELVPVRTKPAKQGRLPAPQ